MILLDRLRDQWLVLSMVGGVALVLVWVLGQGMPWNHPRPADRRESYEWPPPPFPWIVLLLVALTALWAAGYLAWWFVVPPNW